MIRKKNEKQGFSEKFPANPEKRTFKNKPLFFFSMELLVLGGILAVLTAWIFYNRKQFIWKRWLIFYFAMLPTKFGIPTMKKIASKYPRITYWLGIIGICVGYAGMAIVSYDLIKGIYSLLSNPQITVGLVLPVKAKGVFYVPSLYWIISVLVVMVVHEGAHGVMAIAHKLKVKQTGVAFLGAIVPIIPAAFVEPDEDKLMKSKNVTKLSVFAAGPFANLVLGFALLGLYLAIAGPISNTLYEHMGAEIISYIGENSPAQISGLAVGEVITSIDSMPVLEASEFKQAMDLKQIGETIEVKTDKQTLSIMLGEDEIEKDAFLGVNVQSKKGIKPEVLSEYPVLSRIAVWLKDLIYWLSLLNIGVGLFNLVPIGPIDGGRMLQVVLEKIMPQRNALRVWKAVSYGLLAVIASNIIYALTA